MIDEAMIHETDSDICISMLMAYITHIGKACSRAEKKEEQTTSKQRRMTLHCEPTGPGQSR